MKKATKLLNIMAVLAVIFIFSGSASAQGNRLKNPDFEEGYAAGWTRWAITDSISDEENHTPGGLYSVNPSLNEAGGGFEAGALIQEFEDFKPGDTVYASAWIKTDKLRGTDNSKVYALIKIELWDGADMIRAEESEKLSGTNDWKQVNVTTSVPPQATMVKYLLMLYNPRGIIGNTGQAYFDDVYLGTTP